VDGIGEFRTAGRRILDRDLANVGRILNCSVSLVIQGEPDLRRIVARDARRDHAGQVEGKIDLLAVDSAPCTEFDSEVVDRVVNRGADDGDVLTVTDLDRTVISVREIKRVLISQR
jgi:hypothetical protein